MVSELCFTWCACLIPEDTLEALKTAVHHANDANQVAQFKKAMAAARDELGDKYFSPIQHDEAAIKRRAKTLMRKRWEQEATIFETFSDTCTADDLIQWINDLDAGSLHEYALHFNWDTSDWTPLEAILRHPDCDKATAITIYGLASPDFCERPSFDLDDTFDRRIFLEIDKLLTIILDRFRAGGFSTAHFSPTEDVTRLKRDRDIARENGSIKWYLPDDAFVGFEGQPHNPKYEFDFNSGEFRTPFDEWVKIAAMT